ncbi:MAG: hypothetical protein AABZ02_04000, partial [Bacteroidota bacterium]
DVTDPDHIQGTGKSYGTEFTLRYHSTLFNLYAAYSLSWVRINNGGVVYYPRYDRRHHLNVLAVLQPLRGLSTTVRWEYGSGFPFSQTVGYLDRLMFDDAVPGQFELETGSPYVLLGPKNAARLPSYHRLDISANYKFTIIGLDANVGVDLLNVYNHKNIFYFDRKTAQRVNMLSFYPSATLTVEY